ncbi:MAG: ribonuclease P protein component [Candidatus Gallimonas sp.]
MNYLRLKKKKDFSKLLRTGKRAHAATLTVVYLPSKQVKMAVCVGKKYGKSVRRNAIKRLLREAFRAEADRLTVPCSFLLIPKVADAYSYAEFRRDVGKIFRRENLIETSCT